MSYVPRLMTNRIRRQATALKNLVVKALSPLGAAYTGVRDSLALRGRVSLRGDQVRSRGVWSLWLLAFAASMGAAVPAHAATNYKCGPTEPPFYGVIDGNTLTDAEKVDITQIQIVGDCTIQNFPNPPGLGDKSTTINFQIPNDERDTPYIFVFDNVAYNGGMACASITEYMGIWWVNGSFHNIKPSCQDFMLPVDAIRKQNPAGQTTAKVGVPFKYTLTMPLMVKLTSTGYEYQNPIYDDEPLSDVHIYDDLTASGADLTYLGNIAYLKYADGTTTSIGSLANLGSTKNPHFHYDNVPAGAQLVIELEVVLDNTAANAPGRTFQNTATWTFDKIINGLMRDDLPGQDGISDPMTIVGPDLVVDKTSTATNLNLGGTATFEIDVQNVGGADAWNATITDILPTGMCTVSPVSSITAQVFEADGVTQVSGPLIAGTDYTVTYSGCQLSLTLNTAVAKIGPDQRLIVSYEAGLDTSVSSGTLTNVAGATRWFNADSSVSTRLQYDRTLTDGTPGVADFQDAYTVNVAAAGYYFLKSVENLTSGTTPATAALPGDRLRYTLQIQNFTLPTLEVSAITDSLDASFQGGSLALYAPGTNLPVTPTVLPTGGASGTGAISIPAFTVADGQQYQIQFDVTLKSPLPAGTVVPNQAFLTGTYPYGTETRTLTNAPSDDPNTGGPAQLTTPEGIPTMVGDPTRVTILAPGALSKENPAGKRTATIGEQFAYRVTVPAVPVDVPLYDVSIVDDLDASAADLRFVSASVVSGGTWSLSNTGPSDKDLVIRDTATGIDIPAGGQVVIDITVELENTVTNQSGLTFSNTASYTYSRANGSTAPQIAGGADSTENLSIVEPLVTVAKGVTPNTPPTAGDVLQYAVDLIATSGANYSDAFDTGVVDTLSLGLAYVSGTALVDGVAVEPVVAGDGINTPQTLTWSGIDIPAGSTVAVTYDVQVQNSVVANQTLTNSVTARWTSLDGANASERTGTGTPAYNDYFATATTSLTTPGDATTFAKARLTDTYGATDANLRVGDLVDYELRIGLQEGSHTDLVLKDTLPAGMAFENVVSANYFGTAQTPAPAPTVSNQTLTWNLGDVVNATADNDPANDYLVIVYRARVMNNDALAQQPVTQTLTNNATLDYTVGGVAATQLTASETVSVQQPLLAVSKTAAPAGGDSSIVAGEVITYTVDIVNSGTAPAYDTVLVDTLPVGLRQGGVTTTSISLLSGASLTPFDPAFDAATGVATWNFDNGTADAYSIPAGDTLRVVYTVKADADVSGALTLTNAAVATLYYSFDDEAIPANGAVDEREIYGPTNTATATLTTPAPALAKANTQTTAGVGEQFKYRITVPATPVDAALYDVRILDDLNASAADMRFVSASVVSGGAWTLTNTSGSDTNLVIENTAGGIDIPKGGQAVIEITVELLNTPTNVLGLTFTNTADYTYNQVDNTPASQTAGQPGTTAPMQIVGLIAQKTVAIDPDNDNGTKGILDAGDGLIYTITVNNPGTVPVTGVVLTDDLPADTAYVADSVTLNGAPVGQPDGGTLPLASGVAINSVGSASGTIAANGSAVVTFKVTVNGSVPSGTVISNQGYVSSNEPTLPTDADGDASNGYQPTTIVVGSNQQVAITKEVSVVGGGAALPDSVLEYVVRVSNIGAVDATNVQLTDNLASLAGQATYVAGSATLDAGTLVVWAGDNPTLTANVGTLLPGATATLRFSVTVVAALPTGTRLTNTATATWGTAQPASASASIDIGGIVGSATLSGQAWHDANFNDLYDTGEQKLAGWAVGLFRSGVQVASTTTDANGLYSFVGIEPTLTTSGRYELRFTAPGATATTAKLGEADSSYSSLASLTDVTARPVDGMQQISNIDVASGSNVQNLNLPIDPNGVVFNSVTRAPIAGARVTLLQGTAEVAPSCFQDPAQQNQVTLTSGYYKFDLKFSDTDPSCPAAPGNFVIRVTPPATGYVTGPSRIIPPASTDPAIEASATPYSVASCAGDASSAPAGYCEAMASELAPSLSVPAASVVHHLYLTLSTPVPTDSQLFNNHLAVDPTLAETVSISKTASLVNVSRGQMVPYTITVTNTTSGLLERLQIVDTFPPGLKYVEGSARAAGVALVPDRTNRTLTWNNLQLAPNAKLEIKLLFIVGSGVGEGEYVNRAQMFNMANSDATGVATATVRVVPDPTFDCTDIIGKVFDDGNRNGYQDEGEKGLPGVRVATARGLLVTTDPHGRFHISCAVVADEDRGSNFILKVDDRTLPTGYRITTENPRVQRVTRGKMAKFNFGATIHKVVRIDVANGVFAPGTTEMRIQWKPRMELLMGELKKGPSTLRLAYMAEIEDEKLVETRLKTMKQELERLWAQHNGPYELVIETEVFWRTGAPPSRSALK